MAHKITGKDPIAVFDGKVIYKGIRDVKFEFFPTVDFDITKDYYFEYRKCCADAPIIFVKMILKTFVWETGKVKTIEANMTEDRFNYPEFEDFESELKVYVYESEDIIEQEINKLLSMTPEDRWSFLRQREMERLEQEAKKDNWVQDILDRPQKIQEVKDFEDL